MIRGDSGSSSGGRWLNIWMIAGVVILVLFGVGLIVGGVLLNREGQPGAEATQLPTSTPVPVLPTASVPTVTPLPTATPLPEATVPPATDVPLIATMPSAMIEVGEGGVNVRSGPGTNFEAIGRLEPGEKAAVTGKYADWWQIDYSGAVGWVANWVVTASDTDGVAEVEPPASPIPPTAAPKPTDAPAAAGLPLGDSRGLEVVSYSVSGAPGPYSAGAGIPFNFTIVNRSSGTLVYDALGTWVQDTNIFQKSYARHSPELDPPFFEPGFSINNHTDHVSIPTPGTYNLYFAIHFIDGGNITPVLLAGPIQVVVQ